ncbi:SDR family NAD(P)-dependent oxidoreductase [Streptomyces composti]|uniref:SDR family NAD(P)-dependent oxidoreductase n=1 Tax=Streptomyces composti TaxID=2720025 RepID=UPI0019CFFE9A
MTRTRTTHARRTAIVTGAARGIGAAVARQPAADGTAVGVLGPDEADRAATVEAASLASGQVPYAAGGPVD